MPDGAITTRPNANEILRLPLPRLTENSFFAGDSMLRVLTDDALFAACGTRIAFTTRAGGVSEGPYAGLNLSYAVGDARAAVDENRRVLCEALGAKNYMQSLVSPLQVHGSDALMVEDDLDVTRERAGAGADAILCTRSNVPVLLCFADCVPVVLVAPDGSFAVIHSGWRGSIASIAGLGLRELQKATCCPISEINCYIGPHIGSCCYEVADELIMQFVAQFGDACDAGEGHLDLATAVTASLLRAGANEQRIAHSGSCTACHHEEYYSYRADAGITGRHAAFAIREERA